MVSDSNTSNNSKDKDKRNTSHNNRNGNTGTDTSNNFNCNPGALIEERRDVTMVIIEILASIKWQSSQVAHRLKISMGVFLRRPYSIPEALNLNTGPLKVLPFWTPPQASTMQVFSVSLSFLFFQVGCVHILQQNFPSR